MLIAIIVLLALILLTLRRIAGNQVVIHKQMVSNASSVIKALRMNRQARS